MINAAALASGDGAELQALLDSVFFGEIEGFSLSAVIATRRGSFALTRAGSAHVPGYVVDESIFPNGASFSLALLNKLHDLDIDFIILAGFAPKLSEGLARAYRGRKLQDNRSHLIGFPLFLQLYCFNFFSSDKFKG